MSIFLLLSFFSIHLYISISTVFALKERGVGIG